MMLLNMRKPVALVLALLLLLGVVPASAEEGGAPQPAPISGLNTVRIQVEVEESPGVFKPAESILVAHKHQRVGSDAFYAFTGQDGTVNLEGLPDGTAVVYLEVQDTTLPDGTAYSFPAGYVRDEQPFYLQLSHLNRDVSLSFRIKLPPDATQATGAIRVQKAFYPYFIHAEQTAHPDLIVYEGEEVRGAEFVVYAANNEPDMPPRYWSEVRQDFVDSLALATRYQSGLNGQVLIDNLPPGKYRLRETKPPAGSTLPHNATRIENDPYGPYEPVPFTVEENAVVSRHTPVINTPASFIALFMKVDAASSTEDIQPVAGAEFVVYRLTDDKKEYVYYRVPLHPGGPIIPAFTEDIGQAHIFTSGMLFGEAASIFPVLGLPSFVQGTQQPITYYLEETAAAPGYLKNEEPYAFTHLQALDFSAENPEPILLYNQRISHSILVRKTSSHNINALAWATYLAGAEFILLQLEEAFDPSAADPITVRVYQGQQGDEAAFSQELTITAAQLENHETLVSLLMAHNPHKEVSRTPSGTALFEGPLPEGHYMVAETSWPEGYAYTPPQAYAPPEQWPYQTCDITSENNTPAVAFENIPKENTLFLKKTGLDEATPLAGAEFVISVQEDIVDSDPVDRGYLARPPQQGEPQQYTTQISEAHRFVTDENGMLIISHLQQTEGYARFEYTLHEVTAPEGYAPPPDAATNPYMRFRWFPRFVTVRNVGPMQVPVTLRARKTLLGGEMQAGQFQFELVQRNQDSTERTVATSTNDANGDVWFREAWVEQAIGEPFSLVIREVIPPEEERGNILYREHECVIGARVELIAPPEDKPEGMITPFQDTPDITQGIFAILVMDLGGLELPECSFVNEVLPLQPVDVPLTFNKQLLWAHGDDGTPPTLTPGSYAFTLTRLDPASPLNPAEPDANSITVKNAADGSVSFPNIHFEAPGQHRYLLREDVPAGGGELAAHDARSFEVTITLEDRQKDGVYALEPQISYRDLSQSQDTADAPTFVNRVYQPIQAELALKKLLKGQTLTAGQFRFALWQDGAMLKDDITHDAEGNIRVVTPFLNAPGLYDFEVRELAGSETGYTYDSDTLYTIQLQVDADTQGRLTVSETRLFRNGEPFQGDMQFVNAYQSPTPKTTDEPKATDPPKATDKPKATDPPAPSYPTLHIPLQARKMLKNSTLKAGEFTFLLKDSKGTVLVEARNEADGSVRFPDRMFSRAVSNYLYTIEEVKGTDRKTTYDSTVYTVKVSTRAVNGKLEATVHVERDGTPYAGDMVFTNQRKLPPTGDSILQTLGMLVAAAALLSAGAYALQRRRRRSEG